MQHSEFDVIVIGSGMGGLAAASLMSKVFGRRVLLLEQHFKFGGFTHSFRRDGKFEWNVGVHYIGDMREDSMTRRLMDLITDNKVHWRKMKDPFDVFIYPDFTIGFHSDIDRTKEEFAKHFPEERAGIDKFFSDVRLVANYMGRKLSLRALPSFLDQAVHVLDLFPGGIADLTTGAYLSRCIGDERLRAALVSQWGDYGLPPKYSSFAMHALVMNHYFNGGYYPERGAKTIAKAVIEGLEQRGGMVRKMCPVVRILTEQGHVVGVEARDTSVRGDKPVPVHTYTAPVVISDTGAYNTYVRLLDDSVPIRFRDDLKRRYQTDPMLSNVTLYVGFSEDPSERLGLHGQNCWIFSGYDHDQYYEQCDALLEGDVRGAFLSFSAPKDSADEGYTAEIIAFCPHDPFAGWESQPWKKRDASYMRLKERISTALLDYVHCVIPGFRDMVEYSELSTPVTNTFFSAHPRGSIYGMSCQPDRFRREKSPWHQSDTPVKGLYLAGADASTPGLVGAMMGGIIAVCRAEGGISLLRLIKKML